MVWGWSRGCAASSCEQKSGCQPGIEDLHKDVPLYVPARGGRVKAQSEAATVFRECSKDGGEEQKSEARKPKPEGNPKSEA